MFRRLSSASLGAGALAAAALALTGWLASSAGALDTAKPVPGCAGLAFTDPAGDQVDPTGKGPENLDVTAGFFKADGGTTANIRIANLSKDIPLYASGLDWYFAYVVGSTVYYIHASVDFTGTTDFAWGTYDDTTGYTDQDSTAGKFFEGRDGVIQIAVPTAAKGSEGNVLKGPYVSTAESYSVPGVGGFVQTADSGPNSMAGRSYTVGSCESGISDATPPPAPLGKTSTLRIKLLSKRASAARARKGRTLSLRLRSSEKITKLAGRILSGASRNPVVYGIGRLSRINGNGTLRIKLRRPLRRGSYRVDVTGRKAKGQRGTRTLHLTVH